MNPHLIILFVVEIKVVKMEEKIRAKMLERVGGKRKKKGSYLRAINS